MLLGESWSRARFSGAVKKTVVLWTHYRKPLPRLKKTSSNTRAEMKRTIEKIMVGYVNAWTRLAIRAAAD